MLKILLLFLIACGDNSNKKLNENYGKKQLEKQRQEKKEFKIEDYIKIKEESLQLNIAPTKEIFYQNQKGDVQKLISIVKILCEDTNETSEVEIKKLMREHDYKEEELKKILELKENFQNILGPEETRDNYKKVFIDKANRIFNKNFFNKDNLESNKGALIKEYNEYAYKKLVLFSYLFEKAYKENDNMISFTLANLVEGFYNCVTGVISKMEQSTVLLRKHRSYEKVEDFVNDSLTTLKKEILRDLISSKKIDVRNKFGEEVDIDSPHILMFVFSLVKEDIKLAIPFEDYTEFEFVANKEMIKKEFLKEYTLDKIKDFLVEYNLENFEELKNLDRNIALKIILLKEGHLISKK